MDQFSDLILQILTQIGGGPESPENNLVRFALPAIFWAILLAVAWNRQRQGNFPRERLLVWGFGLALFRELFMLAHLSEKLLSKDIHVAHSSYVEPLEHVLAITAVIFIAAAFLRYILDDSVLPRRYLIVGLSTIMITFAATAFWWPKQAALNPEAKFNMTTPALLLHSLELLFIGAAMLILFRKRGGVRNIVLIALSFLFISEFITLFNYATEHIYGHTLCPIGNNLHIWAVPIFGFVYFREQALEKRQAETALRTYRDHLQDLVDARTAELQQATKKLERAAVLEERQRIAAEMHDGLAQTLSTMGLKTGQAAAMLQAGNVDEVIDEFDGMQDIISRAVSDVRRSIASLQQSPQPQQSLQDALDGVLTELANCDNGTDMEHSWTAEPIYMIDADQQQVVRVVQEALLNACRHAQASQITISLQRSAVGLSVTIKDNGIGFDLSTVEKNNSNHFGLSIMRARASRLNGRVTIISQPGQGTTIHLAWPAAFVPPETGDQAPHDQIWVAS